LPEVFEGNPSKIDIGTGKKLRIIQWGSDVFVAGNFDVTANQTVTLPSGTWYNYFAQAKQTATTITLAPGEVAIFTGKELKLPEMPAGYDFDTDVEDVVINTPSEMLPPYNVRVYNINGQLISRQMNAMSADLTNLNAGLYIVQYEKNGQRVAKKIIR
jgi:hypothetical protein